MEALHLSLLLDHCRGRLLGYCLSVAVSDPCGSVHPHIINVPCSFYECPYSFSSVAAPSPYHIARMIRCRCGIFLVFSLSLFFVFGIVVSSLISLLSSTVSNPYTFIQMVFVCVAILYFVIILVPAAMVHILARCCWQTGCGAQALCYDLLSRVMSCPLDWFVHVRAHSFASS